MYIQNYNKNGTYSVGKDGGINWHRNTQDGHGGNAEEHRREMQAIAKEAVFEYAPEIAASIYNSAIERLVGALQYDIDTIVSVSLQDAGEIFNSNRCRQIISDRIMKEIKSQLKDISIKL